jgi:hypothetical protein
MKETIRSVHGKEYRPMTAKELYPTTGAASDWFYSEEVAKIFGHHVYGMTIELRPKGSAGANGFILPPNQIIPTGEEILPAFLQFAETAIAHPLD